MTARPGPAQEIMGWWGSQAEVRLIQTDLAALEVDEPKRDLPCSVTPTKPALGFDLRMHAGYGITIPLRELAGQESRLTIIFRVIPKAGKGQPTYFTQSFKVPPIEADARGETYLEGVYDLGEGTYHVDWLMRDAVERVCTGHWEVEAKLPDRDRDVSLELNPGEVAASRFEAFQEDAPVEREQAQPGLQVKVLINFAPPRANAAVLQPPDRNALLSILRSITREPRVDRFSIVAFNLQEQRVLFRQDDTSRIDYAGLKDALASLSLATVDVKRLSQKHGETQFLADLLQRETAAGPAPDALVFAGPKAMLDQNVPSEELKKLGVINYPVFYMNYNLRPELTPWRDAIGSIVRFFRGTEYTITRPRDMWFAVSEMISRIAQLKSERVSLLAGGQ